MINPTEAKYPYSIILSAGTSLNIGGHEDGDCFTLLKDLPVDVVGPIQKEGLPIRANEVFSDQILFFHQPEPNTNRS